MMIRMRYPRTFQDAGDQFPLDVGEVYELPDAVATSLVATGAAIRLDDEDEPPASATINDATIQRSTR